MRTPVGTPWEDRQRMAAKKLVYSTPVLQGFSEMTASAHCYGGNQDVNYCQAGFTAKSLCITTGQRAGAPPCFTGTEPIGCSNGGTAPYYQAASQSCGNGTYPSNHCKTGTTPAKGCKTGNGF